MNTFSIKKVFADAWEKSKKNKTLFWNALGLIALIHIGFWIVGALGSLVMPFSFIKNHPVFSLIYYLLFFTYYSLTATIVTFLFVSYIRFGIFMGAEIPNSSTLFSNIFSFPFFKIVIIYFLEILIAISIVLSIFNLIPDQAHSPTIPDYAFILLSLLCFYVSARGYFIIPFLYINKLSLWESCKHSFALTKSNALKIILIKLLAILIFAIAFFSLLVGLIWAVPFISTLRGSAWRQLAQRFL